MNDSLHSLWQELALNFSLERADLGNARASMLRPRGSEWFRASLECGDHIKDTSGEPIDARDNRED